MRTVNLLRLSAAAGLVLLAACSKDTTSPSLINQATLTTDVASSSGDAIALDVTALMGAETSASLAPAAGPAAAAMAGDSVSWTFTKTCYDSTGTSVTCGTAAVRKVVTHVTFAGFVNDTAENGATFSGTFLRTANDTLFRIFTSGIETSRVHDGVATGNDTTTFVGPNVTRTHDDSAIDSVEAVTFAVPRTLADFWPISGTIVRNVNVHATYKTATETQTTDITKRVEVDFNGTANVTLKIDNKTCNLNLATHQVSNCQ